MDVVDDEQLARRTLSRFTRGHADNSICWDRDGIDGFINVIALPRIVLVNFRVASRLLRRVIVCTLSARCIVLAIRE